MNPEEPIATKGEIQVENLLLENDLLKQEVQVLKGELQGFIDLSH